MGDLSRPRQLLLACGVLAALSWGASALLLVETPEAIEVPTSAPVAFAEHVGSAPVRAATLLSLLSHLLQLLAAFGIVLAVPSGTGSRRALWGALLLCLGHFASAATSGVAVFVYPRVAAMVAEGRLETVDVVGVMPVGAVVLQVLPITVGAALQATAVWACGRLPGAAGWLIAVGTVASLLGGNVVRGAGAWLVVLSVWTAGAAWLLWAVSAQPATDPRKAEVSLDSLEGQSSEGEDAE